MRKQSEINQEYTNLAANVGHLIYQIYAALNNMSKLELELSQVKAIEDLLEKQKAEKETDEDHKD